MDDTDLPAMTDDQAASAIVQAPPDAIVQASRDQQFQRLLTRTLVLATLHVNETLATGNPLRKDQMARSVVPHLVRALVHEEAQDQRYEDLRRLFEENNRLLREQMGGRAIDAEVVSDDGIPEDAPGPTPPRGMEADIDRARHNHPSSRLRSVT